MKNFVFIFTLLSTFLALGEVIPFTKWLLPANTVKAKNNITISSEKNKGSNIAWAPFQTVGKNKIWKVAVKLSGSGKIQASLGCYAEQKKRFISRYPFTEDTRKLNLPKVTEVVWYLTLPKLKDQISFVRPALKVTAGKFSIQEVKIEAFKKMPLIEEYIPLAKFSAPKTSKVTDNEIFATAEHSKRGELIWGPFRTVGDVKVWQVTVEFTGRGDLQCSLGCYDEKKRFATRFPFSDGNRELNSVSPTKAVWYLTLPNKQRNIQYVRPVLRVFTGEFKITSVHIKELAAQVAAKNNLDTSVTMVNEILPTYTEKNLFPGFIGKDKTILGLDKELVLENTKNASRVFKLSPEIPVESGKEYILTSLYHTDNLKFGNRGSIVILTNSQAKKWPNSLDEFKPYSPLCMGELVNKKPGLWQRKTVLYTPKKNVKSIRIGVYLSGNPASIKWRSIYFGLGPWKNDNRVRDYDLTRNYRINTPTLPKAKVDEILAKRPNATAEILPGNYPRLLINGKKELPIVYFGDAFEPARNKTAAFQEAGIHLQIIPLFRKDYYWVGNKQYRFDHIDKSIMENVRRNPNGNFIIGLTLTPYINWAEEFPTETAVNRTGKAQVSRHGRKSPPCLYSKVYQAQALDYIAAAINHMKKQPYYKSIVGFMLTGNEDGQFYYQVKYGRYRDEAYPPSALEPFRAFLRKRYNNDVAALKKSWNRKNVTFENAAPPRVLRPVNTFFWDRSKDMAYYDTSVFMNEAMGEFADAMCNQAKKVAGKKVLSVMWWGRGGEQFVQPHFAQTKVILPGKGMDLMGGQPGYWGERENGNISYYPHIVDSIRLNNKISMIEADFRTWLSVYKNLRTDYHVCRYLTPEEFRNALFREAGKLLSVAGGLWFYDMTAGWFNDPVIMKDAATLKRIADKLATNEKPFSPAEIALVADEANFLATSEQLHCWNGPNFHSVRKTQRSMMRAGVKYDYIYLTDLIARKMNHHKVYCFLNLWHINKETEAYINSLRKDGKTLVFVYAAGFSTDKGLDVSNISRITGINVEQLSSGTQNAVFVNSPLTKKIIGKSAGLDNALGLLRFGVNDKNAQVIAKYTDGKVASAMKKFQNYTTIYLAQPSPFTAEFLANIAEYAGVHIYNKTPGDMFIHRRDDFIAMHGVEGNTNIVVPLPGKKLYDFTTGKELPAKDDKTYEIKLAPGETRLLECK